MADEVDEGCRPELGVTWWFVNMEKSLSTDVDCLDIISVSQKQQQNRNTGAPSGSDVQEDVAISVHHIGLLVGNGKLAESMTFCGLGFNGL